MILAIGALILTALILLFISSHQRKSAGLPPGRVISSDPKLWGNLDKPLYDPDHHLTGRPDYLVRDGDKLIPVEIKSRRVSQTPLDSHIYQLAAYCMLVDHTFRSRPPYGILHYPNNTFAIDYTAELEADLSRLLADMHSKERVREVHRSHASPSRCRRCGFNSVCDQALR
jgi:CRISPR-associated exonuclease Cas4